MRVLGIEACGASLVARLLDLLCSEHEPPRGDTAVERHVVCLREPAGAVAALLHAEPESHTWNSANELWLRSSADALAGVREGETLLVLHERLAEDPSAELARLAAFARVELGEVAPSRRDEIGASLRDGAVAASASLAELAARENVPLEARALHVAVTAADQASRAGAAGASDLFLAAERLAAQLAPAFADREARELAADELEALRESEREHRIALDHAREQLGFAQREADGEEGSDEEREGLEAALVGAQHQLAKTREALTSERHRRRSLEESLSWRVTGPLRSAGRARRRSGPGSS